HGRRCRIEAGFDLLGAPLGEQAQARAGAAADAVAAEKPEAEDAEHRKQADAQQPGQSHRRLTAPGENRDGAPDLQADLDPAEDSKGESDARGGQEPVPEREPLVDRHTDRGSAEAKAPAAPA